MYTVISWIARVLCILMVLALIPALSARVLSKLNTEQIDVEPNDKSLSQRFYAEAEEPVIPDNSSKQEPDFELEYDQQQRPETKSSSLQDRIAQEKELREQRKASIGRKKTRRAEIKRIESFIEHHRDEIRSIQQHYATRTSLETRNFANNRIKYHRKIIDDLQTELRSVRRRDIE